jgi:hypothetical protein
MPKSLLVASAALFLAPLSSAQGLRVDTAADGKGDSAYFVKWDSVQDRVILYRDVSSRELPAARVFGNDGSSVPIYPLRDLDESWYIGVWNAAATPEGGLALAAFVGYGPPNARPPVRWLLLTYDGDGNLTKVWNTEPYLHHLVAVDGEGDIFALGDRDDVDGPYPLVVKYSPSGHVLAEFLSSGLFPEGDKVVSSNSASGENCMFVKGDRLFLWLARPQEILEFSLAGDLLARVSLARALGEVAAATGNDRTRVLSLIATDKGEILAQVSLWPKPGAGPVRFAMVRIGVEGSRATLIGLVEDAPHLGRFLGLTSEGKLVFLNRDRQGNVGEVRAY